MKLSTLRIIAITLFSISSASAQCLNGGCEVGLSRESIKNGVFIGHYQEGERLGLGISYLFNPTGTSTSYTNYISGKKNGVEYHREVETANNTTTHTFKNYFDDTFIYPALRIIKQDKSTAIEVIFSESEGWRKYDGDEKKNNLEVKSTVHDGSPVFLAFNDGNQVMAIATTVSSIELLSSELTEKYYNPLQMDFNDDRLVISLFPKAGSDETSFRASLDWDMEHPEEGLWLYKRYFNNKLSYKLTYSEILELPSEREIKQQKLQTAFELIAKQAEDYDYENGYVGKVQDFIDMLQDIKERAELKGLTISQTYDITMTKLYLQMGNQEKSSYYAQTACVKSINSLTILREYISSKFKEDLNILDNITLSERLVLKQD